MTEYNQNLNLNPARADKFSLRFSDFPSLDLLSPEETSELDKITFRQDDRDFFHLGLKTAQLPGFSLGEVKINNTFTPLSDTDMNFEFDSFTTTMRLDSNYILYKMLFLWLFQIKHPSKGSQFSMKEIHEKSVVNVLLMVKNSFNETVLELEIYDLRPLSIPNIDLDYTNSGEEILLEVEWSYSYFLPKKKGGDDYNIVRPRY
jgi:hypothetical protein